MALTGTLAQADWESHRPAVFGAAYRILGTVAEAEDVTQEVWLRAAAADLSGVRDLRAWLVTVAARRSYNVLKSARVRRESYVGPWLPEPLPTGPDAADRVVVDELVSTAMLVVMEALGPAERVALVLHDVFGFPFGRIAEVLDSTPAATRKLASRARARVAAVEQRPRASGAETQRMLEAFKAAADAGDMAGLVELLDPDAVYVADGGGKARAARRPVHGAEPIARLAVRQMAVRRPDTSRIVEVNGLPALATYQGGELIWLDTVEVAGGRITALRRLANPDKFAHSGHVLGGGDGVRRVEPGDEGPAARAARGRAGGTERRGGPPAGRDARFAVGWRGLRARLRHDRLAGGGAAGGFTSCRRRAGPPVGRRRSTVRSPWWRRRCP